nr:DapH/DapD/GlmU-related protein [Actinomyces lilanjuaniae]
MVTNSRLGNNVFVGYRCLIDGATIHNSAMIASRSRIGAGAIIGEGAWVGASAHIDSGVHVSEGAIIGAGAHVTADIPAQTIALGKPATRHIPRIINDSTASLGIRKTIDTVSRRTDLYKAAWPPDAKIEAGALNDAHINGGAGLRVAAGSVLMGRPTADTPHGGIRIGTDVTIGSECILEASGGLDIGNYSTIGAEVTILTSGHDYSALSLPRITTPVRIGTGVTIESGATLVGPLNISDDALVQADHIVVHDVAPGDVSHSII